MIGKKKVNYMWLVKITIYYTESIFVITVKF
ncbi:MAG: hypothetical protein AMDU4_FER2C00173G0006 [Ferroplasma sp. Type II]|jgi:hypothetical protein|nr:MAG: hypothetical protein AMDU4_FER2C00173G0006 [Ferroplasma sp. Type II]